MLAHIAVDTHNKRIIFELLAMLHALCIGLVLQVKDYV